MTMIKRRVNQIESQTPLEKCANEHEQLTENHVKSYGGNDVDAKLEFELQRDRDV